MLCCIGLRVIVIPPLRPGPQMRRQLTVVANRDFRLVIFRHWETEDYQALPLPLSKQDKGDQCQSICGELWGAVSKA